MKLLHDRSAQSSNFVALVLLSSLSKWICSHMTMEIGQEWFHEQGKSVWAGHLPSFCLSSFLTSAVHLVGQSSVTSAADLAALIDQLRALFEVVEGCPEQCKQRALELLEHCLTLAEADAKAALHEATSDFPISGGSFSVWESERVAAVLNSLATSRP